MQERVGREGLYQTTMPSIVIIGAGGHAREVADILGHQAQQDQNVLVRGFIDDNHLLHGQLIDGLPVLGDWTWFEKIDLNSIAVICAVGSPHICRRLVERAKGLGLSFANAISPLAYVSPRASIGQGVIIFPYAVVNVGACVQHFCTVNIGSTISHDTTIGCYSNINPGAHLAGNVTLGEGCYIGMGANIIQGRSIGAWAIVGAGAVVIADLPENITAVGVPAKVISKVGNAPLTT